MPQRRREAPGRKGEGGGCSRSSRPSVRCAIHGVYSFAIPGFVLRVRLRRLQSTRVKSTAGELAGPLQQSHLMQRQLTLRSRLMFDMSTLTTISYFHEDGNDRRRGLLLRTE